MHELVIDASIDRALGAHLAADYQEKFIAEQARKTGKAPTAIARYLDYVAKNYSSKFEKTVTDALKLESAAVSTPTSGANGFNLVNRDISIMATRISLPHGQRVRLPLNDLRSIVQADDLV